MYVFRTGPITSILRSNSSALLVYSKTPASNLLLQQSSHFRLKGLHHIQIHLFSKPVIKRESTFAQKVASFGKRRPFIFQLCIATVKTCLADMLVQVTMDHKSFSEIDWKRNAVFVSFGFGYLGCMQYFLYVKVMRFLWPAMDKFANLPTIAAKLADKAGLRALIGQICTDCFFITPFCYYPTFYCFKQVMQGEPDRSFPEIFTAAIANYRQNALSDNLAFWKLWLPMDFVIYCMPIWLRLPCVHMVCLFLLIYIS